MIGLKQWMGRSIQSAYTGLPLSWRARLAIKDALFTALAPLLRNTNVFRRWEAFNNTRQPEATRSMTHVAVEASAVPLDENEATHKYVEDLLQAATTAHGPEYMPLAPGLKPPGQAAAKAIAFYLPQFHPIAENDEWWGRGFTEWTNVSKAVPQFLGHYQPRMPGELGFYDLRLVQVLARQAELARMHGLHGFCFHHYWFSGKRLLQGPVDMLLAHPEIDLPFSLCWANENWTRRWDGQDDDVLLAQDYSEDNDLNFIRDALPYMQDQRYIRLDGRPLLVVYRPSLLPDCKRTLATWREFCRKEGLGEIFLAMVQFDLHEPGTQGFDAALEFPPHKLARNLAPINEALHVVNKQYGGHVVDYGQLVDAAINWPTPSYPLFRGVSPSWDNEARKPGRGYTFANSTPALYSRWLKSAVAYSNAHPVAGENVVFINAWNEWAEGAYLEPDRKFGYAYLQATRSVLDSGSGRGKVLLVSHDAHPHGAQYLALNLVREIKNGLGLDVETLLMGEGRLEAEFEGLGKVHRLYDPHVQRAELLSSLRENGFDLVVANTAVSGRMVAELKEAGFTIVSLLHELPGVVHQYGLESAIVDIFQCSDRVVAGSPAVREGLRQFVGTRADEVILRPQGLYVRSRYRGLEDLAEPRQRLRERLGLGANARVVLAVGYADERKGVDLLARAAVQACAADSTLHFVWVGHRDARMESVVDAILAASPALDRFHFMGLDMDTDDYYAGADLYALASREDPFPSVVLESLSVGVPVVAFAGTGGGADFLGRGCGATVPAFDVGQYAQKLQSLLNDDAARACLGRRGRELIDSEFSFRAYAIDLLRLGGVPLARVSVVVPNYNYAHYLRARLESVARQSWPLYEIIVLDDCSLDDSLQCLQELRSTIHPEPVLVKNQDNSGSVFRQWLKGVQKARGEYVWIAEADDLALPDFVERLVRAMEAEPEVVLGYCQSQQIDAYGQVMAPDYLAYTHELSSTRWENDYIAEGRDEVETAMAVKNAIPNVSAVLFRREALLQVLQERIEDIAAYRIAGDWLVYLYLLRKGRIMFVAEPLNQHRRHESSVTIGSDFELHYDEVARVQEVAAKLFEVSAPTVDRARRYAGSLRRQFGLGPSIESAN